MGSGKNKDAAGKAVKQSKKVNDAAASGSSDSDETANPGQPAGAHLDAPSAANTDPVDELVVEPGKTVAIVSKGNEKLPVQLRDKAHLDELIATHGAGSVEVQP